MKAKTIVLLTMILLSMVVNPVVFGANEIKPILFWVNTDSVTVELAFADLKANCTAYIVGKTDTTKITATAILQRKDTNGSLTTVKTWSGLVATGNELLIDKSYYVDTGYTYSTTA